MSRIRKLRPSPAMAVAFVALFVAGAGGATAAKSLISGKQVKNNSLTGKDIKDKSVSGKDIKDRSLLSRDFKRGQIPAGPQGPQGVAGPAGRAGRDGFGTLSYNALSFEFPDTDTELDFVGVPCPTGQYPTGGLVVQENEAGDYVSGAVKAELFGTDENGVPIGWGADVENLTGETIIVTVGVVCANASQPPASLAKRTRLQKQLK